MAGSAVPGPFQSLEDCDRQLATPGLSDAEQARVLCAKGQVLSQQRQHLRAIACLDDALQLRPGWVAAYAHRAIAHEGLGQYDQARADFEAAIEQLPKGETARAIWLWHQHGNTCRSLGRYRDALTSYERVLALDPDHAEVCSSRGTVLAMLRHRKRALRSCQHAIELAPDSVIVHNNLGIVLLMMGRRTQALDSFERALLIQPDFNKAWHNRAIALLRLGRDREAFESIERALSIESGHHESWHASAWMLRGYNQMKLGQFDAAVESCERSQSLQPHLYGAALYKLISLVASGRWLNRLAKADSRSVMLHDVGVVLNAIKYRLLVIAAVLGLVVFGEGPVLDALRSLIPPLFSAAIIALIGVDLWMHKSKLRLVWQVYFRSGILTYVRAIGIIVATLGTFTIVESIVPPFMLWGWANLVFGQPGNIIFQPFNLFNLSQQGVWAGGFEAAEALLYQSESLLGLLSPGGHALVRLLELGSVGAIAAHAPLQSSLTVLFIIGFWLMLLLGIPFWARLEERIFRQGAHTWRKIMVRSTQFGLVHLIAGIPIVAGFVLIVPGFLFACRYKYVHDRHFKTYQSPIAAQEAGVQASTADHAVYNALLVTLVVSTLLLSRASQ